MKMPKNVSRILEKIIANEGGFQNDPRDTGNYAGSRLVGTNYGITPNALAAFRGVDVEEITEDDIRNLSKEDALEIYAQDYYYKPGYDKIEGDDLRANIVDMAVNAGAPQATKLLQRIVGADVDGILGPQTLQAINDSGVTTNDYSTERKRYYLDITLSDPTKLPFLMGWVNRANKYIVRDYPEGGVIPLDIVTEVDEQIKKPLAALPKQEVAQTQAKAVADEVVPLEFNQDMFMDPALVAEYQDPDGFAVPVNPNMKPMFS
jgi:lysozyme family protein